MSEKSIEIGRRIKMAGDLRGRTQSELGKDVGICKATVAKYEAGTVERIQIPMIQAIAKYLDVDPSWISLKTDDIGEFDKRINNNPISPKARIVALEYDAHPEMQHPTQKPTELIERLIEKYDDPSKVLMAYNMGEYGASVLWGQGVAETSYSRKILARANEFETELKGGNEK